MSNDYNVRIKQFIIHDLSVYLFVVVVFVILYTPFDFPSIVHTPFNNNWLPVYNRSSLSYALNFCISRLAVIDMKWSTDVLLCAANGAVVSILFIRSLVTSQNIFSVVLIFFLFTIKPSYRPLVWRYLIRDEYLNSQVKIKIKSKLQNYKYWW